ncbi:hypothetical protein QE364_003899 [Nocardioides zeae]|uniref:Uncharacterized protein n=1 Tax=Nocardioides zeae TaxID=1457234 RepID=A0ACC6INE0_9ACTN|nr:hypothetical protein [Nocardioides zeae]MDR6212168.1 hypothetical protein [Nocardioides zeae]
MTVLPYAVGGDDQWVFHQRKVGVFADAVLPVDASTFLLALPVVDTDRLWLIERIVATSNAEAVELRLAVDPQRPAVRRATEEPAAIVDFLPAPGRVAVVSRPAAIAVPEEHRLTVEWKGMSAAPGPSGYAVGIRADVVVLRRL